MVSFTFTPGDSNTGKERKGGWVDPEVSVDVVANRRKPIIQSVVC
jgi:hypothetical protein